MNKILTTIVCGFTLLQTSCLSFMFLHPINRDDISSLQQRPDTEQRTEQPPIESTDPKGLLRNSQ
jgi:hypothetical protein